MLRFLTFSILLFAATASANSPNDVLDKYVTHLKADQWEELVALVHPDEARNVRDLLEVIIGYERKYGESRFQILLYGMEVESPDSAPAMTDYEMLAKVMEALVVTLRFERFELEDYELLGFVKEGRNIRHGLVRLKLLHETKVRKSLQIHTLEKYEGDWYMHLPENIMGVLQMVELRYRHMP